MRSLLFWPLRPVSIHPRSLRPRAVHDQVCGQVDALFDEWGDRVYGYIRKMVGSDEDAQDLTQEVFLRALRTWQRQPSPAAPKAWLFEVAHNLVVDFSRRRRVRAVTASAISFDEVVEECTPATTIPDAECLSFEAQQRLTEAVDSLSEKLRAVLWLHDQEGLTYQEIARVLDLPLGTVKSRLFLARNQIATVMHAYWFGEGES